jgi:hypothetical protein
MIATSNSVSKIDIYTEPQWSSTESFILSTASSNSRPDLHAPLSTNNRHYSVSCTDLKAAEASIYTSRHQEVNIRIECYKINTNVNLKYPTTNRLNIWCLVSVILYYSEYIIFQEDTQLERSNADRTCRGDYYHPHGSYGAKSPDNCRF